jgi:hypothetical protein
MEQTKNEVQAGDGVNAGRRSFLKYSGAMAATAVLIQGCKKDDDDPDAVNLGSGDIGILNYAYALEQLEAAFYTNVVADPYTNMSAEESQIMNDLKAHEIAHRDFLKAALATHAIPELEVNFSAINFKDRGSVLGAAKTFEDLGVAAYNGAGHLIEDTGYLLIAGKIVSVEARHAAAIRDLISPGTASFSGDDVVDGNGLDGSMAPAAVLSAASAYLKTKLNGSNLPS